jgi:hypothetical protein
MPQEPNHYTNPTTNTYTSTNLRWDASTFRWENLNEGTSLESLSPFVVEPPKLLLMEEYNHWGAPEFIRHAYGSNVHHWVLFVDQSGWCDTDKWVAIPTLKEE